MDAGSDLFELARHGRAPQGEYFGKRMVVAQRPVFAAGKAIEHFFAYGRVFEVNEDRPGVVQLVASRYQQGCIICIGEMGQREIDASGEMVLLTQMSMFCAM